MWWFGRQLSWSLGRGWKIPFYLSGVQSLSPLPVSEEHGCKGPEFASWVTACLVSPNFAWLALNHLQKNNAPTNLHCDKNLDHNCEHTFVSILVFNFDQHFDGGWNLQFWSWASFGHNFDQNCIFQWLSTKITFFPAPYYICTTYIWTFPAPYCNIICIRFFSAPYCNTGLVFSCTKFTVFYLRWQTSAGGSRRTPEQTFPNFQPTSP